MLWQKEYNASKETGTLPAKYAKRREKRKDFPFNFVTTQAQSDKGLQTSRHKGT